MPETWTDEVLADALHALAPRLETPAIPDDLPEVVLARLAGEPVPSRPAVLARSAELARRTVTRARSRVAWLTALVVGALLVVVLATPVGARVAEWFDFHGVVVERGDSPEPTGTPTVPPVDESLTLAEAEALVGFDVRAPAALGEPDGVAVSRRGTLVSMSWGRGSGTVRLDQFDGRLSPAFRKSAPDSEPVAVGAAEGLWFLRPHRLAVLGPEGELLVAPRLAAQTLIWADGGTTFRLEGRFSRAEALALAESVP